jgi:hypothetical protein
MQDWDTKAQALPDDADEKESSSSGRRSRRRSREQAVAGDRRPSRRDRQRSGTPSRRDEADDEPKQERKFPAGPRGSKEPKTYTRDLVQGRSFFVDLVNATRGDIEASDAARAAHDRSRV